MVFELEKASIKDFDNISLTAYRIISMFNMLLEAPCSDDEINEKLQEDIMMNRSLSKDTIYIYINTLRAIGCEITRPSRNNGYKYILKSHPFLIKATDEEITALVEVRKYISTLKDWKLMVNIDELYNKIVENIHNDDRKKFSQIKKSMLRAIDTNHQTYLINILEKYCEKKRTLLISYLSPVSGDKLIEMTVDKLAYENEALYLWGYNLETEETQYLRVDRISDIKVVNIRTNKYTPKTYSVKYKLTGVSMSFYSPCESEIIKEKNEDSIVIEAKVENKFKLIQKLLSYGSDCVVLAPDNIKKEIISKLRSMSKIYE